MSEEIKREVEKVKEKKNLFENLQNIAIIIAMIMGVKKPSQSLGGGEEGGGETIKQLPMWVIELFPGLTREDENEFNLIMSSFPDKKIRKVEATFRERFKKEGYDETYYRLGLVGMRREFMKRLKSPAPKDESGGRLQFEAVKLSCPTEDFLQTILECSEKYNEEEKIYQHQRKIGLDRLVLKKISPLKKFFSWAGKHKIDFIVGIFLIPIGIIELFFWLLN